MQLTTTGLTVPELDPKPEAHLVPPEKFNSQTYLQKTVLNQQDEDPLSHELLPFEFLKPG